jgi:hypothetical protein
VHRQTLGSLAGAVAASKRGTQRTGSYFGPEVCVVSRITGLRLRGSPARAIIITTANMHCIVTFRHASRVHRPNATWRYTSWGIYALKDGTAAAGISDICGVLNSRGKGVSHPSLGFYDDSPRPEGR